MRHDAQWLGATATTLATARSRHGRGTAPSDSPGSMVRRELEALPGGGGPQSRATPRAQAPLARSCPDWTRGPGLEIFPALRAGPLSGRSIWRHGVRRRHPRRGEGGRGGCDTTGAGEGRERAPTVVAQRARPGCNARQNGTLGGRTRAARRSAEGASGAQRHCLFYFPVCFLSSCPRCEGELRA